MLELYINSWLIYECQKQIFIMQIIQFFYSKEKSNEWYILGTDFSLLITCFS